MAEPRHRLLVVATIPADLRAAFDRAYDLVDHASLSAPSGPFATTAGFDVAVTTGMRGFDEAMMAAVPDLGLIVSQGVGLERIDLAAARRRGIAVCHTPDELTEDVAEAAIALTFAIMRRVVEADHFVRAGRWLKERMAPSTRVAGKTMGIVGLGKIGRSIAARATALGMTVAYHGRRQQADAPYTYVGDPRELAATADVLVLSCVGDAGTRHLIGAAALEALGPAGYLVNVARGSVVDEAALLDALEQGRIAGAALDVFADEPRIDPRFLALGNVVLQPHSASITHETRAAIIDRMLRDTAAYLAKQPFHDATRG
ncbi:MAG TPA: 2-hydroxyacid dehydrogenase [Xanthobacteraceae bacterium]|nr:2-hydroxyacid dehydrogenase [Xanthobacteraceae bacterium]